MRGLCTSYDLCTVFFFKKIVDVSYFFLTADMLDCESCFCRRSRFSNGFGLDDLNLDVIALRSGTSSTPEAGMKDSGAC